MAEGGVSAPSVVAARAPKPLQRRALPGATSGRLFFAQVHEDPLLEIEALGPVPGERIVVVSSGGCTALSLLAAGAGQVIAVDLNATQNHLVELKHAAVTRLGGTLAVGFLGGAWAAPPFRLATYGRLRSELSPAARAYWDARGRDVARGVIHAGASERFMALIVRVIRALVHPERRIRRLLACRTLEEQRAFYDREWNTWRWRALFTVLLNRRALGRSHDPAFFKNVETRSFARHFLDVAAHALTELSVADNYFLHVALRGSYPANGAVPPYLTSDGAASLADAADRLTLVDGSLTDYLRTQPDDSIAGFAVSNICEWLVPEDVERLFAEIARTAVRGATVCFRNFVGWTEVPARWCDVIVEDRTRGAAMSRRDRSLVQRRFAVCRVEKAVP